LYDAPQSVGSRSRNLKAAIPALLIKISIVPNSAKAFQRQYLPELISASAVIALFFTRRARAYIIDFGFEFWQLG
jgi:hypothetical protein